LPYSRQFRQCEIFVIASLLKKAIAPDLKMKNQNPGQNHLKHKILELSKKIPFGGVVDLKGGGHM
jgi:hypothetical protein